MSPSEASITPSDDAQYQQLYEQVRAKDDISFKLLSLVPLISGAGISILVKTDIAWGSEMLRQLIRCNCDLQHLQVGVAQHSVVRLALEAGKTNRISCCASGSIGNRSKQAVIIK